MGKNIAIIVLGSLLSSPAFAARHEINIGYFGQAPADHDNQATPDALPAVHISGGYAVLRNEHVVGFVVRAGWWHAQQRLRSYRRGYMDLGVPDYGGPQSYDSALFRTLVDSVSIGAKVDFEVANIFYPYLTADVALVHARRVATSGLEEARGHASAPEGVFTVGFEFMVPDHKLNIPATVAFYLDAGYAVSGEMTFSTFGGRMQTTGAVVRTGLGARF